MGSGPPTVQQENSLHELHLRRQSRNLTRRDSHRRYPGDSHRRYPGESRSPKFRELRFGKKAKPNTLQSEVSEFDGESQSQSENKL
jgi:hypothetical protein